MIKAFQAFKGSTVHNRSLSSKTPLLRGTLLALNPHIIAKPASFQNRKSQGFEVLGPTTHKISCPSLFSNILVLNAMPVCAQFDRTKALSVLVVVGHGAEKAERTGWPLSYSGSPATESKWELRGGNMGYLCPEIFLKPGNCVPRSPCKRPPEAFLFNHPTIRLLSLIFPREIADHIISFNDYHLLSHFQPLFSQGKPCSGQRDSEGSVGLFASKAVRTEHFDILEKCVGLNNKKEANNWQWEEGLWGVVFEVVVGPEAP